MKTSLDKGYQAQLKTRPQDSSEDHAYPSKSELAHLNQGQTLINGPTLELF